MQVLEHQQERARFGQARYTAEERLEEPDALALGIDVRKLRQRGKPRANLRQQLRNGSQRNVRLQRGNQRQCGTQRVDDAFVWSCFGRAGGTEENAAAALFDGVRELEDRARLADAGLAADEDAGAATASGAAPRLQELAPLGMATDERQDGRTILQRGNGGFERGVRLSRLAAGDRLAQRERFSHGCNLEFEAEQLREAFVLGERSGAVARFRALRHHLAHHVFAPRIDRENLLRAGNSTNEVALTAGLRNELHQRCQIGVAAALALGKYPFVVDRGYQVAAIEFDRLFQPLRIGDEPIELFDVQPQAQIRAQADVVAVEDQRFLRKLRQDAAQVEEARPQLRSRRLFLIVGPHDVREEFARDGSVAIEQQIGQNRQCLARRGEPKGLPVHLDGDVTEEPDSDFGLGDGSGHATRFAGQARGYLLMDRTTNRVRRSVFAARRSIRQRSLRWRRCRLCSRVKRPADAGVFQTYLCRSCRCLAGIARAAGSIGRPSTALRVTPGGRVRNYRWLGAVDRSRVSARALFNSLRSLLHVGARADGRLRARRGAPELLVYGRARASPLGSRCEPSRPGVGCGQGSRW